MNRFSMTPFGWKLLLNTLCVLTVLALVACDTGGGGSGNTNGSQTYAKALWGEWLRMDTGDKWYISNNALQVNGAEASTSAVLTKQSDRVIEVTDGGRKYYLYASRTATASFTGTIVGDAGAGSARAASKGRGKVRVSIENLVNKANESSAVTDEDGKFTAEGVILGDAYKLTPEGGTSVTVIPTSDGDDIGVVTITSGVNFKTSLIPTQSSTDMTELYMNMIYQFNLEFENTGDEDCPAPSYTITAPSGVTITGTLQGILGTIEPGVKKGVSIGVLCSAMAGDHEYKKINIRIEDGAGKTWDDSVSLRFYKETMGFNIKAEKPVSGIIISPDSKTYSFTDVTNGTVVTPRRVSGDYLVVFSGATIETETRYALGIGIEADGYFGGFTQTGRYEPNNTESATVSLSEQKIMAYLYKNDIDYYRVSYGNFNVPPAPTNVSASAADAHVRVSWNAVTGAQSYNVYRVDSQTGAYTKVGTSTTASYTETVARVGTYYYRISAVSTDGFESARSAPTAAAVTGPSAPTNVSASVADAQVTVSWTAVTEAKSYNVYRSDSQTGTYTKVGASTTASYVDTVARAGTYYYKMGAVGASGFESAHSVSTTVTVAGPPAPTNVTTSAADTQVTVSWTTVTEAESYNVYRSDSQTGTYTKVGASTSSPYTETVGAMGTYYYKVSAISASGFESAPSTPTAVAVAGPPAPTGVSASVADAQVTVSWNAVTGASSYNVYRSDSQTGTYTKLGAPTTASYVDTITATGTYYYKVSAMSASDFESALSTPTTVMAGPAVPTNITASAADAQVTVSWTAVTGASSYNVYRSTSQTGTYTKLGAPTTTSYVDTVTATGTYYYKASAVSMGGLESGHSASTTVAVTTIGIDVTSLSETLSWLSSNAVNSTHYTLSLTRDETIPAQTLSYSSMDVTVTLKGKGGERIVSLSGNGSLFTINRGVTLVLEDGVTFKGHSSNNTALVRVNSGGNLVLKDGGEISGNTASYSGGGVYVGGGTFTMSGGEISGNSANIGGGVWVSSSGTFTMSRGEISGNSASAGGGVFVSDGTFTMSGGTISGNTASNGGGVYVYSNGTFTMSGGTISGNTASNGGGVYVYSNGTFTMSGGTISGNTASSSYYFGGGVSVSSNGTFTKQSGGIIYGSDATSALQNTATRGNNYGHAVYVDSSPTRKRNTTAGVGETLDSTKDGSAGGWE